MKPYRPSNGTEGMGFEENYCSQCVHEHIPSEKYCDIIARAMAFDINDKEYPTEWIYNDEGTPVCTSWQKWDWGDGYDGWNEPPEPPYEPQDPNQLTIFTIDELIEQNNKTLLKL